MYRGQFFEFVTLLAKEDIRTTRYNIIIVSINSHCAYYNKPSQYFNEY